MKKKIEPEYIEFELFRIIITTEGEKKFETVERPPGVRMLIIKGDKILITEEYRRELQFWDFRLPGGKVFDTFKAYRDEYLDKTESEQFEKVKEAVIFETKQETGLVVGTDELQFLEKSVAGSSVIWDLFYFEINEFEGSIDNQELEAGEMIKRPIWRTFNEVKEMCRVKQINEGRSVAILYRYFDNLGTSK
jgi:hypothetical protein